MSPQEFTPATSRTHRRYSAAFKAEVIAACLEPGVSIAAVALANQLNANFLRRWVKVHRDQQLAGITANTRIEPRIEPANCSPPTLVPVTLQASDVQPSGDIQIEIRRQQTVFQVSWPTSQAVACAQWLREILQ
ncbi:transposase [Collimonas sp.]|uniref:transposase n=1 Tax=Collimonas sp. TaxID=1963772 RepID=UPI002CA2DB1F|nr:transposase [Collimonas sp.]HWW07993.1 transposase [Collimonas sp.]